MMMMMNALATRDNNNDDDDGDIPSSVLGLVDDLRIHLSPFSRDTRRHDRPSFFLYLPRKWVYP